MAGAMEAHLPFAGTGHAVRIDGQQVAREMTPGRRTRPKPLQFLGLGNGVGVEQLVDG